MTRTGTTVRAGAEPFYADGGDLGIVLSHGFTGSPASMRPLGQALAEAGHTVSVPLLPGHGTRWQDLHASGWHEWYAGIARELSALRERCSRVVVAGLSMGGALALRLAQRRHHDVDALVLINPAIASGRRDLLAVPFLHHFVASLSGLGNDIAKPGADEVAYARTPLRALASQLHLWRDVRAELDRVEQPVLLLHSPQDHLVDATGADLLRSTLTDLTYVELLSSYHVATLDYDAELIARRTADFVAERVSHG